MCNCIKESEQKLKEHYVKELNIKEEDVTNFSYDNTALFLSENPGETSKIRITLPFEIEFKKYGAKRNKNKVYVTPSYCPFCGVKY